MKLIVEIIMKYKCQVLPDSGEDWEVICKESMKEYALEVIEEITENISYYTDNNYSVAVYMDEERIEQLKKQIQDEQV